MFEVASLAVLLGLSNGAIATEPSGAALINGDDEEVCSGIVISPHVVLTARSCVNGIVEVYIGPGRTVDDESIHGVVTTHVHPDAPDLALIVIDPATTKRPAELPANASMLLPGELVRFIGFGRSIDPESEHIKREGTAWVLSQSGTRLGLGFMPSASCQGDTGGGLFLAGNIVRGLIVSSGDDCLDEFNAVSVTPFPSDFQEFMDLVEEGVALPGGMCLYQGHCSSGDCFQRSDGGFPYCSTSCTRTDECPLDMECELERCMHPSPSPGAVGSACTTNVDCYDDLCNRRSAGETSMCSKRCTPGKEQCPEGYACAKDVDDGDSCFPATEEQGCGCQSNQRPDGSLFAGLLLLLVSLRRRSH